MSVHGSFLSDEQFQCSICLDVFINPSSTPCGHSFCMACISRYWDGSKVCQCPLCKKTFQKRPDLHINRTLREITEQFKSSRGGGGSGRDKRGGGTSEGFFEELKKKLPRPLPKLPLKRNIETTADATLLATSVPNPSPLATMITPIGPPPLPPPFCRSNGRRRFTVTGAASSNNLPLCEIHHRGLLMYCRTDNVCICPDCATEDHYDHDTVNIEDEWTATKAQLSVSEREIEDMIKQRVKKIEEIKLSVTELEAAIDRETAGSVCLFSVLVSAIERSQAELMEVMEMSRRAAEHQAEVMIRQLELEVEELRRRETVLAELSQLDDALHGVKTFPALSNHPPSKDWSSVSVNTDLGTGTIYRSLAAQVENFHKELKSVAESGFPSMALEPSPVRGHPRIKRVQEYAVDVTLDYNTAHPRLIVSEDMKSVKCGDKHQMLPDNPERFDRVVCILGRDTITSGKHYWEVEVGGKTDWDLGVARHSMNRKGKIDVTPSNGYWFLSLRDKNKYGCRSEPSIDVQMSLRPQKIGVFVDYERGQVSFYNVDSQLHIYTFNDNFDDWIYPFFSPCTNKSGKNEGPLIITPVIMTE
ncbi:E3 ubiquitin-protein ligase TRIM39 [Xyrichtys novacula]|uniref:E3 ubiquitin-protein ligase TRIM39 n=1 Tax=Xyrichtys novacula TaxID=13765 RepID=A0AAV1HJ24_XYRNO|nr:E3 ubiquitin-protein ligase TRIM39 [Xyrichtys novacula]